MGVVIALPPKQGAPDYRKINSIIGTPCPNHQTLFKTSDFMHAPKPISSVCINPSIHRALESSQTSESERNESKNPSGSRKLHAN